MLLRVVGNIKVSLIKIQKLQTIIASIIDLPWNNLYLMAIKSTYFDHERVGYLTAELFAVILCGLTFALS